MKGPQKKPDTLALRIYDHVRPSAGEGRIVYGADEAGGAEIEQDKGLIRDLLGFWPPDDMRGVYISGQSMDGGNGSPYRDGQLLLYEPTDHFESGERYVLLASDAVTGDWQLLFKRVRTFAGGGLVLVSENPHYDFSDETLLPDEELGALVHQTTGLPVQIRVVGHVLWPTLSEDARSVRAATRAIERLAAAGVIAQPGA